MGHIKLCVGGVCADLGLSFILFAFPKAMAACGLLHNMSVDAAIRSHVAPGLQLEVEPN